MSRLHAARSLRSSASPSLPRNRPLLTRSCPTQLRLPVRPPAPASHRTSSLRLAAASAVELHHLLRARCMYSPASSRPRFRIHSLWAPAHPSCSCGSTFLMMRHPSLPAPFSAARLPSALERFANDFQASFRNLHDKDFQQYFQTTFRKGFLKGFLKMASQMLWI